VADTDQSFTTDIEAPIDACESVLLGFERYPEWSSPISSARVLARDEAGRGRDVEFELDMKLRTIRYVLRYAHDLPARSTWELVEGDVTSVTGSYDFEALGPRRTRATCRQAVDLGFWLPGFVRRTFEQKALRDSVLEFKAEAERRARAAG